MFELGFFHDLFSYFTAGFILQNGVSTNMYDK